MFMDPELFDGTVVTGISTLIAGRVFKQKDITEVQIKKTLIPATTCRNEFLKYSLRYSLEIHQYTDAID